MGLHGWAVSQSDRERWRRIVGGGGYNYFDVAVYILISTNDKQEQYTFR